MCIRDRSRMPDDGDALQDEAQGMPVDGGGDLEGEKRVAGEKAEQGAVAERPSPAGERRHQHRPLRIGHADSDGDVLAGRPLRPRLLCRTFSDCTTAPRNGLVSGCFPIDPFYKDHPQRVQLTQAKKDAKARLR